MTLKKKKKTNTNVIRESECDTESLLFIFLPHLIMDNLIGLNGYTKSALIHADIFLTTLIISCQSYHNALAFQTTVGEL